MTIPYLLSKPKIPKVTKPLIRLNKSLRKSTKLSQIEKNEQITTIRNIKTKTKITIR